MRPLIVGLTGGIGSGKSTVCSEFASLGVPIIDTDLIARGLVATGQPALHEITRHFGLVILNGDGSLNRAMLRQIIFREPRQKRFIEELLHPLILEQVKQQIASSNAPYLIIEIPLLLEAGWQSFVDQILVIDLPDGLQLERLSIRKKIAHTELQKIIASQLSRADRNRYADQMIDNSKTLAELSQQVAALHQQYLRLAEMRQP